MLLHNKAVQCPITTSLLSGFLTSEDVTRAEPRSVAGRLQSLSAGERHKRFLSVRFKMTDSMLRLQRCVSLCVCERGIRSDRIRHFGKKLNSHPQFSHHSEHLCSLAVSVESYIKLPQIHTDTLQLLFTLMSNVTFTRP